MNKQEAEKIIEKLTEKQNSKTAFIKGVLYGTGFTITCPEPNWQIIEKLIEKGNDPAGWLNIEKETHEIRKKIMQEHVDLWTSLLRE